MNSIKERAEDYAWKVWSNPMFAQEWDECVNNYIQVATEQRAIDIDTIPQLYLRWLMIDGEKPSWVEYATKVMEE